RQVQGTPGLANRLRVVFGRPGWRPAEQGGPLAIPAVDETTHQKYHVAPARGVPGYVLAQYVVLVGVAALFVFTQKNMEPTTRYLLALWIAAGVVAGGGLLENRAWAWQLEVPRLLASLGLLVVLLWGSPWLLGAGAAGSVAVLAAAAWLYKLRPVGATTDAAAGVTA
ncbi:MAG: hypothetical protein H7Z21_04145, partial [Hymenobacter sp.]|nr:hypothetical protein [Hymenobacter sp.]